MILKDSQNKRIIRIDLIVNIRNYIDQFSDYEIIQEICGSDLSSFKHNLYDLNAQTLNSIYEETQIGLSSSKDYDNFVQMFSTSLKISEFVSNIVLGILSGLRKRRDKNCHILSNVLLV